jgi:Fe-S oxidoreductase
VARELVERVVNAAEKQGVKTVISPECGRAYIGPLWEGPNLLRRPKKFGVIQIPDLLEQLRQEGRLRFQGTIRTRLSFHNPCHTVRRGGVTEASRRPLDEVATDFLHMPDTGVMN